MVRPKPIPSGSIIAIDIESDGLDPFAGARVFGFGYFTNFGEYGWFEKSHTSIEWLKKLFNDSSKEIIFHNAKFDLKMLLFEGIDIWNMKAKVHCTLIESKLHNENGSHKLRDLGIHYLTQSPHDKDEVDEWITKNKRKFKRTYERDPNYSDAPIGMVRRRCLWDVETTMLLHLLLNPKINKQCQSLYETERKLIFVVIDMEMTGVRVNISRAYELKQQSKIAMHRIKKFLNRILCPLGNVQRKRKGIVVSEIVEDFNPNSNPQLEAAWKKLNVKLKYKTEKGKWAFDEFSMIRYSPTELYTLFREASDTGMQPLKFIDKILQVSKDNKLNDAAVVPGLIMEWRKQSKMISTYYDAIIDRAVNRKIIRGQEYGTLHCSFNQSRALTGRFSSSGPNLQNVPRILGPRECFEPRAGRWNWHFDYEQIEMKLFVHFTHDPIMAEAIKEDIHLHVASEIYNLPITRITKEQRKRAKMVNFGIIYGVGPRTLARNMTAKGLPTSQVEAKLLLVRYHRRFPSVRTLTLKLKKNLIRKGYVESPFHRRYHIPYKVGYKTTNNLIQGTSADEMKEAMVKIWEWLKVTKKRTKITMVIHDEVVLEIPHNERDVIPQEIIKLMEQKDRYFTSITVGIDIATKQWSRKVSSSKLGFELVHIE